jgi:hypothetical protein
LLPTPASVGNPGFKFRSQPVGLVGGSNDRADHDNVLQRRTGSGRLPRFTTSAVAVPSYPGIVNTISALSLRSASRANAARSASTG